MRENQTVTFRAAFYFKSGREKTVVITEGELDAASVYEALGNYPVVSLPSGAAAAKKAIKQNLNGFNSSVNYPC